MDIYYCNGVDITKPQEIVEVNGIGLNSGLTYDTSALSVSAVEFNGVNAYKCKANSQGKVFVDPSLIANKSTFTFSVFVPVTSNNALVGFGEFAIRVKPNHLVHIGASVGYIEYNTKETADSVRLTFGEWITYTVDISSFGNSCTEFAFVIAAGNTIYLKDMMVS